MPICLSAYVPQWITIVRNRSSDDISLRSYGMWTFGASLGVFYAVMQLAAYGTGLMLLLSSLLNWGCLVVTMILIALSRRKISMFSERYQSTTVSLVQEAGNVVSLIASAPALDVEPPTASPQEITAQS